MKLKFVMPEGFEEEKNTEFDKSPALRGPRLRLISLKRDVIIAINTMPHDTSARGRKTLKFIRKITPNHERNQNYYSYVRMLVDSIHYPLKMMEKKDLQFYHADYGAEFTIKDGKNPYLEEFPVNRAFTMFKTNHGDVFLFYFFNKSLSTKEAERILKKTKGFITY